MPFVTAVATSAMYVGSLFIPWAVVYGAIPIAIGLIGWFWPKSGRSPRDLEADIQSRRVATREQVSLSQPIIDVSKLPSYSFHHRSIVWWGTMGIIAIDGLMFALLITAYLYLK